MTWVKLDDQFADNPKLERAGPLAAWLSVAALCYSACHLTDGLLPKAKAARLADVPSPAKHIKALVREGVWHEPGHACESALCGDVPEGHYLIHDYLDYQRSRAEVEAEREKEREKKRQQRKSGSSSRNGDGTFAGTPPGTPPGSPPGTTNGTTPGNPDGSPSVPDPTRPDLGDSRSQPTDVGTRPDSAGGPGSDPPEPDPPLDTDALLTAAATILANAERDRRAARGELDNPTGYRNSRIAPLRRDNEQFWWLVLSENPTSTARQLADAVLVAETPSNGNGRHAQPDPTAGQREAARTRREADMARNAEALATPDAPLEAVTAAVAEANRLLGRSAPA